MNSLKFSNQLYNFFDSLNKITPDTHTYNDMPKIICNFIKGPYIEILGGNNKKYSVVFIDIDDDYKIIYQDEIYTNHWTRAYRQWYTNWKIQVFCDNVLVYEHIYNCKDKRVYIHLASNSLGDTIAWFPYLDEFRKKNGCKLICSTFYNDLFKDIYTDITFVSPGTTVKNIYAMYEVGIYDNNTNKNKIDSKLVPLQKVSSDILGIKFSEMIPTIHTDTKFSMNIDKYVAISTESTAKCKFWNNINGWQEVIDYLNNIGYKVIVLQNNKSQFKNVIDLSGKPLDTTINIINNSDFFIGLSSGLSWVSWALKKKTILISGFTENWYEFSTNCYRVYNKNVCNGCWHRYTFNKSDWNWCPDKNNFICSTEIASEMVIAEIQKILK